MNRPASRRRVGFRRIPTWEAAPSRLQRPRPTIAAPCRTNRAPHQPMPPTPADQRRTNRRHRPAVVAGLARDRHPATTRKHRSSPRRLAAGDRSCGGLCAIDPAGISHRENLRNRQSRLTAWRPKPGYKSRERSCPRSPYMDSSPTASCFFWLRSTRTYIRHRRGGRRPRAWMGRSNRGCLSACRHVVCLRATRLLPQRM
jgi:hypothetical protein